MELEEPGLAEEENYSEWSWIKMKIEHLLANYLYNRIDFQVYVMKYAMCNPGSSNENSLTNICTILLVKILFRNLSDQLFVLNWKCKHFKSSILAME
jgi:hypothetical protein